MLNNMEHIFVIGHNTTSISRKWVSNQVVDDIDPKMYSSNLP